MRVLELKMTSMLSYNGLKMCPQDHSCFLDGVFIGLTNMEFIILKILMVQSAVGGGR